MKNYEWREPSVMYAEDIYPYTLGEKELAAIGVAVAYATSQAVAAIAAALTTIRGYVGKPENHIYKIKKDT